MAVPILALIGALIAREGGYTNDPLDRGGETNYGITIDTARRNGYGGTMRDMPRSVAVQIYTNEYWTRPNFDHVAVTFPKLGEKLFDTGVNCGVRFASTILQRFLTVHNNQGKLYPDLKPDGEIGPVTIAALRSYLNARPGADGQRVLLFMIAAFQGVRYVELAEANPGNEKYLYGWEKERALYDSVI